MALYSKRTREDYVIVTAFNGTAMDIKFYEGQKTLSYPFVFEKNIIEKL